jgi:hypothetical protein
MEEFIDFDNKSELAFTPEGKLLISMLNQAIEDALYVSPKHKGGITEGSSRSMASKNNLANRTKVEAIQWLFDDNDVYELCCELAGTHKDKVRQFIINKIGAKIIYPLVYGFYRPDGS